MGTLALTADNAKGGSWFYRCHLCISSLIDLLIWIERVGVEGGGRGEEVKATLEAIRWNKEFRKTPHV